MTKFVFDRAAFERDWSSLSIDGVTKLCEQLAQMMKKDISNTDTKNEWIKEISGLVKTRVEAQMSSATHGEVGLIDVEPGSWVEHRADVVEYGMGHRRRNPNADWPVRHMRGKPGVNDDMTGMNTNPKTLQRASYVMPDAFNHSGSHFFENANILGKELIYDVADQIFESMNFLDYIYAQ